MSHVVVIATRFDEPQDDRAIASRGFASACASRGMIVHVVTLMGEGWRPAFECDGPFQMHRVSAPAPGGARGIASRMVERAREILAARRCEAVECFDAPEAAVIASMARATRLHRCPVIHTELSVHIGLASEAAREWADLSLTANDLAAPNRLDRALTPAMLGVIPAPPVTGPAFVAPVTLDKNTQTLIVEAFHRAGAARAGWSLACAKGMGRWSGHAGAIEGRSVSNTHDPLAIWIEAGSGDHDPTACRMALACGRVCLVSEASALASQIPPEIRSLLVFRRDDAGSLAQKMIEAMSLDATRRASAGSMLVDRFGTNASPERFVEARLALWKAARVERCPSDWVKSWARLERLAGAMSPMLAESAG